MDGQSFIGFYKHGFLLDVLTPLMNFLLPYDATSHVNSQSLLQMGLEMASFLLYMTENQGCSYSSLGHYTKNGMQSIMLVHNLLKIMGN